MTESAKNPRNTELPAWLPLVIGVLLVIQFAGLSVWQFNKGLDKRAERDLYTDAASGTAYRSGMEVVPYQHLRITGEFDTERQILLDNIVIEGSLGYYVITPFVTRAEGPVILVNRGWVPRNPAGQNPPDVALPALDTQTIRGRAGSLPRAGMKMGDAFNAGQDWPKIAVYPSAGDVAVELGEPVDPVVLLLDPQDANGYFRLWEPEEMSAGRHFAYALQWFAMSAVLLALLVYHHRRSRQKRD